MKFKLYLSNLTGGLIPVLIVLKAGIAILYLGDLASSAILLRTTTLPWATREILELFVGLCLLSAPVIIYFQYRRLGLESRDLNERYLQASSSVTLFVNREFDLWGLTPSERIVASYVLKGLSNSEIAALNGTKVGTIKAQCNALFRKSGTKNKSQFNSYFFEFLIVEQATDEV